MPHAPLKFAPFAEPWPSPQHVPVPAEERIDAVLP